MSLHFTVFISHVSEDESIAIALKRLIETVFLNARVFVAGRDLAGGELWVKEIRDQLRVARVIIAVVTPFSKSSPWVLFEAGAGFVDSRTIPVCTDGIRVADLEPPLKLLQAREVTSEGLGKLCCDIAKRAELREPDKLPSLDDTIQDIKDFLEARSQSNSQVKSPPAPPKLIAGLVGADKDPELQKLLEKVKERIRETTIASLEAARGNFDIPSHEELARMTQDELNDVSDFFNIPRPIWANASLLGISLDMPGVNDSRWKKMNFRKSIEEVNNALDEFLQEFSTKISHRIDKALMESPESAP